MPVAVLAPTEPPVSVFQSLAYAGLCLFWLMLLWQGASAFARGTRAFVFEVSMQNESQTLADVPLLLLLLVAVAGLVGEMRQADVPGVTTGEIVRRVMLRFGSSALFGMASLMLAMWWWGNLMLAGGVGIIVGLLGADIAGALYTRYAAKKAGIAISRGE